MTGQGTYKVEPYHSRKILIGIDAEGNRVSVEIEAEFLGEDTELRTTTELKDFQGPYVRLCFHGVAHDPENEIDVYAGQMRAGIEKYVDAFQKLFVTKEWVNSFLEYWHRYHQNDLKSGTEAQIAFVEQTAKRWPKRTHEFYCAMLRKKGLLVDRGFLYGSGRLLRPIPVDELDKFSELLVVGDEMSDAAVGREDQGEGINLEEMVKLANAKE